jgi:hypothetical protein
MPEALLGVAIAALGALIGALIKHAFEKQTEARLAEREVLEKHLLQLQDAVESLYYRLNNLCDWSGRDIMSEAYYRDTTIYAFARVLAHEQLFVSAGVFARIRDRQFRRDLKSLLHRLNWCLRDGRFFHYFRLQIAEQAAGEGRVLSYSEFLRRGTDPIFHDASAAAGQFVKGIPQKQLQQARELARRLVSVLESQTAVPSALTLATEDDAVPD